MINAMINCDINALKKVMKRHGYTELHFATMECSISKIRRLLDKGASPNARDEADMTLLHYATQDCPEAIPILIKYGTDPHTGDEGDMTPLHYATMHRSLNAAETLIKHSDVNARDKDGRTPHLALEYGHCNVALLLIESGHRHPRPALNGPSGRGRGATRASTAGHPPTTAGLGLEAPTF